MKGGLGVVRRSSLFCSSGSGLQFGSKRHHVREYRRMVKASVVDPQIRRILSETTDHFFDFNCDDVAANARKNAAAEIQMRRLAILVEAPVRRCARTGGACASPSMNSNRSGSRSIYRLKSSKTKRRQAKKTTKTNADNIDPKIGEITAT